MTIEAIAQIAHEINRVYCQSIGEAAKPHWEDAPESQRQSALAGVRTIADRSVKSPSESHESWFKQKQQNGWKHGDAIDEEKREHPCMVPFSELAPEQRLKDAVFFHVVGTLLSVAGPTSNVGQIVWKPSKRVPV